MAFDKKLCCGKNQGSGVGSGFGIGFLTTPEVGIGFFVRLRMSNWIVFLHHTPKLGIPIEMVQFLLKLLLKQRFLVVHHDFH